MLTGRLEDCPLPRVLEQLYAGRFTGELAINTPQGLVQTYFRDGYPVYVNMAESADLLGRILVEMKVFDEAALKRSLAVPPDPGKRYGDVVLMLKLCDDAALKQALRAQVRRKLHRLFQLTSGGFVAIPSEHGRGIQAGESLRVHPRRVIYSGVRSFGKDRLKAALEPLSGRSVRIAPERPFDPENSTRFGFGAEEEYIVEMLRRGFFSLQELVEAARLDVMLVLHVAYTLWVTGLLAVADGDAAPRGREHIGDMPPPPRSSTAASAQPQGPSPSSPPGQRAPEPRPAAPRTAPRSETFDSIPALELEAKAPLSSASSPQGAAAPPSPQSGAPPAAPAAATSASHEDLPQKTGASPQNVPQAAAQPQQLTFQRPPQQGAAGAQRNQAAPKAARPVSFEEVALMRADIENKAKAVDYETLFAVLGLPENADEAAVKAAFIGAAKKYHPDRIIALGLQNLMPHAEKVFRKINEAHQVLTDKERRDEYMAELKLKSSSGDRALKEKDLAVRAVNAELAFSRGTVFLRKRDYVSAVREFEESVRLNPDEGEHLGYYTWARFCANDAGAAECLKDMQKAVRMAPKCGRLFYFLGVLYKQEGNEDKALSCFQKAKDLDERVEEADTEIRLINMRRNKRGGKAGASDKRSAESKGSEKKKGGFFDRLNLSGKK